MTAKSAGGETRKKGTQSFEKSLERLEKIVGEMEGGRLSLDDMIARFEEGQGLIKFCSEKLNEVERKIEVLVRKGDKTETEPFGEDGTEAEDAGDEEGDSSGELF
jgi:exodeoxyribonuclease VII small subunit